MKGRKISIGLEQIIIIAITLSYLIFPADIIPDIIPLIGLLDDACVLLGGLGIIYYRGDTKR